MNNKTYEKQIEHKQKKRATVLLFTKELLGNTTYNASYQEKYNVYYMIIQDSKYF